MFLISLKKKKKKKKFVSVGEKITSTKLKFNFLNYDKN